MEEKSCKVRCRNCYKKDVLEQSKANVRCVIKKATVRLNKRRRCSIYGGPDLHGR